MRKIIFILILMPIIDLYILIKASQAMGFGTTILFIILTGIAGLLLAISEGKLVIRSINMEISRGSIPGESILIGLCILIGGLLLAVPGIVTDIIGITMVIPGTRGIYKQYIKRLLQKMINKRYTNIIIRR
ncbi:MAG: FxsA family protein [Tissierellia bacterium]|nr:FxsA family protein [Tissierellia bacterium]